MSTSGKRDGPGGPRLAPLGMFDRVYSPLFRLLVRLPSPTMRRYRRVESDLNRVIAEMIAERRAAGASGDDLLSCCCVRVRTGPA